MVCALITTRVVVSARFRDDILTYSLEPEWIVGILKRQLAEGSGLQSLDLR